MRAFDRKGATAISGLDIPTYLQVCGLEQRANMLGNKIAGRIDLLFTTIYTVVMKYTPSQFRDAVGITQETLRHWRKVLPVYADRVGYSPAFTISDLIVGVIIKRMRTELGVSVARLAEISQKLGLACDRSSWENLECSTIFLNMENQNCSLHSRTSLPQSDGLQVVLPLGPVLRQISDALMQGDENNQPKLPLSFDNAATNIRQAGKV